MGGLRTKNPILTLAITLFSSLIFQGQAVFAESTLTISLNTNSVSLDANPGLLAIASQTITASSSGPGGYIVRLGTPGSTSSLVNTSDNTIEVPTFVMPEGSLSVPASSTGYGFGYSVDNGLNYSSMPLPGVLVDLFEVANPGTNTHTLTFGARVSFDIPPGTYTNSFDISVITNYVPECPPNYICYSSNGDEGTGSMPDQSASSNSSVQLIASNYSRLGYGFAGWNTQADGSGTNYGPNETITTGDLSVSGLQLYARWIAATGNLQNWSGCDSMESGDIIALIDTRDNNAYAVTKYEDEKCWMMENLRLDLSNPNLQISDLNTNNPTTSFANAINQNHPASTNSFCTNNNAACVNQILHNTNNTNRNLTASYDANDTSSSWFSYGNYYNWYTITAGNGTFDLSTPGAMVEGDICPANWKLPTGYGNAGDYAVLDLAMGGNGQNQDTGNSGVAATRRWRAYPLNFIYSGEQKGNTAANRNVSSSYATLNTSSAERTINLWIRAAGVGLNSNNTPKVRGQTARCVYNPAYVEIGNIHYDANGGTGTMPDEENVNLGTAVAATNTFTKQFASFQGWNTSANGTGITVLEGGSVAAAAEYMEVTSGGTLTLYAIWKSEYTLVYDGNGSTAGSMTNANVTSLSNGKYTFVAPNFSRTGYGFAGWSLDDSAATKLANGNAVTIYGPNEAITVNDAFLANADANNQITVYAVWLAADTTKTFQTFGTADCTAMNSGSVIALRDERDNDVYSVAKLADGNCWMTENLRLIPSATTFSDGKTNSPTQDFVSAAPLSSTSNTLCNDDNDATCIDQVAFNSNAINRSLSPVYNGNTTTNSWYSYGVMYNWYTASAGNGTYAMTSGDVAGDICPYGWRLPTGGNSGEFNTLNNVANGGLTNTDIGLVRFPNNFIYSGDYNHDKPGGRGSYGRYWSATPNGNNNAYRLGVTAAGATPKGSYTKWDAFAVRCIVK